jgi:hypothetical protein
MSEVLRTPYFERKPEFHPEDLLQCHRTLMFITGVEESDTAQSVISGVVFGSLIKEPVEFEADRVPPNLRQELMPGAWFEIHANLDATQSQDVDPINFELAPPPVRDEDIG